MFCDIHEGVYLQHLIPRISDTNSALLHAQFEKSQTKRTTFLWKKKAVPLMKVLLILKISWGKVTNFSEVTKFFPDEIFPRLFFPEKVPGHALTEF